MVSRESEERRDFMRMLVNCEVRFGSSARGRSFSGQVKNLSARGLLFSTAQALEVGEQIELVINSPGGAVPPLEATADVVRIDDAEGDGLYEVAVALRQVH